MSENKADFSFKSKVQETAQNFNLTRRLSGFEILNNASLIFQKWLVSRIFANICRYLNFPEEY